MQQIISHCGLMLNSQTFQERTVSWYGFHLKYLVFIEKYMQLFLLFNQYPGPRGSVTTLFAFNVIYNWVFLAVTSIVCFSNQTVWIFALIFLWFLIKFLQYIYEFLTRFFKIFHCFLKVQHLKFLFYGFLNFSIFFSILSDSFMPSGPNNFNPLSWWGLWEAVIIIPIFAFIDFVSIAKPFVGKGPNV